MAEKDYGKRDLSDAEDGIRPLGLVTESIDETSPENKKKAAEAALLQGAAKVVARVIDAVKSAK